MIPYADVEYYTNEYKGSVLQDKQDNAEKFLTSASEHINSLTYNRIVGRGIESLTPWQQNVIRTVCCKLAEFEYENEDMLNCVLSGYSINGVSMNFGANWNVKVIGGVAIKADIYKLLEQSGLCTGVI
ncbi:MAG: hypothetical protein ACI4EV_02110 [Lachnospiraceae bacterium]